MRKSTDQTLKNTLRDTLEKIIARHSRTLKDILEKIIDQTLKDLSVRECP